MNPDQIPQNPGSDQAVHCLPLIQQFLDIDRGKTDLNPLTAQLSSVLSSACDFKSHFCKQCGPKSDCSSRSSLIWVHTVCLYAKIGLKSLQEYSADDINRRHFQMQVFLTS